MHYDFGIKIPHLKALFSFPVPALYHAATIDPLPEGPMTQSVSDALIKDVLTRVKTIAVVGASMNTARPSHNVTRFLIDRGYQVFPINPGQAGKDIGGRTILARLADLPAPVDMVDIFRAAPQAGDSVDEALALPHPPKVIWMQLGVVNETAAERARAAGLTVIMDRCPHIEIDRLGL